MVAPFISRLTTAAYATLFGLSLSLPLAATAQTISSFAPSTAAPGTIVSIYGAGLAATQAVSINGQLMPVATKAANLVTVTVPVAASTGRLQLTTSTGTTLSSAALGVTRTSSRLTCSPLEQATTTDGNAVSVTNNYSTPTACDLNNDGLMDLLVGDASGYLECYSKSSATANTLISRGRLTANGVSLKVNNFAKCCVADLDGDGLWELIVGTGTGAGLMCYEQTAAGAFTFGTGTALTAKASASATAATISLGNYPKPCISDLDGNGLLDLLVGDYNGSLNRFEQSAPNSPVFVAMGALTDAGGLVISTGSDTTKPCVVDIDGDGYLDLVVGSHDGSLKVYTQTGSKAVTFKYLGFLTTNGTTAISTSALGGYAAPCITDYDGNGRLDFFIGNGNGTLYRYEQNASTSTPAITAPLPVVLTSFGGQALAAGNQLDWATASETKSDYFAVERSTDGAAFTQLTQLAAANSLTGHRYQYLDAAAPEGLAYYRLRQVDQDGTTSYSAVVTVSRAASQAATKPQAYPTAFDTELNLVLPDATEAQAAAVALFSATGQAVYRQALTLTTEPLALALPTLAPGQYLLRITTATGTTSQQVVRR